MHSALGDVDGYLSAGFALIPIPPGKKGPLFKGWQLEKNAIRSNDDPRVTQLRGQSLGIAHRWCGTCAIDIDDFIASEVWLSQKNITLVDLLTCGDAVQIKSGRHNRAKLLYRLPSDVGWLPTFKIDEAGLEFRCADRTGNSTVQDVLPPSIHPETRQPYTWIGDWQNLPVIPHELLSVWKTLCKQLPKPSENGTQHNSFVVEGQRNAWLTSVAGTMRRRGLSREAIEAALQEQNRSACRPPLPAEEVSTIAQSVSRYAFEPEELRYSFQQKPKTLQQSSDQPFLIPITDAINNIHKADELIAEYLEKRAFAVLFGPSGQGKTFVALDMALSVASGKHWQQHQTSQCPVIYLNGEGQRGMGKRIKAWLLHHGFIDDDVPFFLTRHALSLTQEEETQRLILAAKSVKAEFIVIDTLARNFMGDENTASDMSTFISHIGYLQAETNCAVLVVHHTGLTTTDRARGNNQLNGALDSEFKVMREGDLIALTATKQKDIELNETMFLDTEKVIFKSADNDDLSSLIVKATDKKPIKKEVLAGAVKTLFATIQTMQNETRMRLEKANRIDYEEPRVSRRELAKRMTSMSSDNLRQQLARLKRTGHVDLNRYDVWVVEDDGWTE